MHPPPHFDVWYEFARSKNVQLIDEYDAITHLLKPFWGIPPAIIRTNARLVFSAEQNEFPGIVIRNGKIGRTEGLAPREETYVNSIREMMDSFAQYLPDMDLVINPKHEPSIIKSQDALARYVRDAGRVRRPQVPRNHFSPTPADLLEGISLHAGSNVFETNAQTAWSSMTQSCPITSPARNPDGSDNLAAYSYENFIYNTTASVDVCNQPSLSHHHGFFNRPTTLLYSSSLPPVFSVSKISSFNDILMPPPDVYSQGRSVENGTDIDWEDKIDQLFWRGESPTDSSIVQRIVTENKEPVPILKNVNSHWIKDTVPTAEIQSLFDIKFTTALDDTEGVISTESAVVAEEIWKSKYVLNLDGPGQSTPALYTLLGSKSLVFKASVFQAWHDEFLWPWVHYIPLGLDGGDWFESLRYFATEESGKSEGKLIAKESAEWANKVLRKEDMEVCMFRLLLEYAPQFFGFTDVQVRKSNR